MIEPTVIVTSTTRRSFSPDRAVLRVSFNTEGATKEACTAAYNAAYAATEAALAAAGIDAADIKTEDFAVNVRQEALYKPYEGGGGYYWCKQVPDGYECFGALSVKIPADAEAVARVLAVMDDAGEGVSFGLSYELANRDEAVTGLLQQAVAEAVDKARALAAGVGKTVTDVKRISFGTDTDRLPMARTYNAMAAKCAMGEDCAATFNPTDIQVECEVTVEMGLA